MRYLSSSDLNFQADLESLSQFEDTVSSDISAAVERILRLVKDSGDTALVQLTKDLDRYAADTFDQLIVGTEELDLAFQSLDADQRAALQTAASRIRDYHERQKADSWAYEDELGNELGQKITPIGRAGIYVPGGKAAYPSSVMMNAIPAMVAGVREIYMVAPCPGGNVSNLVLAAAKLSGVSKVFKIGGAQAIAALAYGTESVPKVDKIVGPGNAYVAEAKRRVFGMVGIDMIAGPSEILIIADGTANPDWVAMDLFSQAEHDELAQAILVSPDEAYLKEVESRISKLIPGMARKEIIQTSLNNRGAMIHTKSLEEACDVSNILAPEHLELSVQDPDALLPKITSAGAIFMGIRSSESLGDYCAGPNHVLPTSGTSRFSSPLGVYDFQKRSSLIKISERGSNELGQVASILARGEGLEAHALSAEMRLSGE
ncbi:MAG: histidinol dehydrogenase [Betaproteobacteria bacterium]|jgi:histidinol dehydrogenase